MRHIPETQNITYDVRPWEILWVKSSTAPKWPETGRKAANPNVWYLHWWKTLKNQSAYRPARHDTPAKQQEMIVITENSAKLATIMVLFDIIDFKGSFSTVTFNVPPLLFDWREAAKSRSYLRDLRRSANVARLKRARRIRSFQNMRHKTQQSAKARVKARYLKYFYPVMKMASGFRVTTSKIRRRK